MPNPSLREHLSSQREAIADNLNNMALAILATHGDEGAALVGAVIEQCIEVVRWTIYDPSDKETP